jgi:hypothetical protein
VLGAALDEMAVPLRERRVVREGAVVTCQRQDVGELDVGARFEVANQAMR